MAEAEGSDDTSDELLNKSLSVWSAKSALGKERFEPIPLDLHTASSLGQYECVKNYITRGEVDLDKRNTGGWTAVMYACYIGHDTIVSLLLEADINVNIRNHKGETPLMLAASCGNERVGFLLCGHGAKLELKDERGWTALFHATYSGHQNMHGAELELKDERGWTALFHATYSGHQNMVRFLLEQGANINAVEQSVGMTPFMEAAAEGHEIILQLFLQHGVNVNAKAYNGDTARSLALINGNMKIVSLIDNHVMPITALRSEPGLVADLSSSDDAFSKVRTKPRGRVRGSGGGPSIMDGPQAIARLIDRTRDNTPAKQEDGVVPKGYVTFPEEEPTSQASKKLSYRDVTSPINPEDYKLDSSAGRDPFEVEDDSNAFSKTGALTIKSSSGSSGGLAAALGIRREDSLDSDEFPHESSCEDSHPHGNSGDSSSEDGVDETTGLANQISETLKLKSAEEGTSGHGQVETSAKSVKRRKSKDKLTTKNVNEIEVMKNSVSEWIDSVQDTHPIPEDDPIPEDNPVSKDNPNLEDNPSLSVNPNVPDNSSLADNPSLDDKPLSEGNLEVIDPEENLQSKDPVPGSLDCRLSSGLSTGLSAGLSTGDNPSQVVIPDTVFDKISALKPEYRHAAKAKHKDSDSHKLQSKTFDIGMHQSKAVKTADIPNTTSAVFDKLQQTPSHMPTQLQLNTPTGADFFDQVVQKVQALDQDLSSAGPPPIQDVSVTSDAATSAVVIQGKPVQYVGEQGVTPVSTLSLLNTVTDTYTSPQDLATLPKTQGSNPGNHHNTAGYYDNHPAMPPVQQVAAGLLPTGFSAYQMFPSGVAPSFPTQTPPTTAVYPGAVSATAGRDTNADIAQTDASSVSNALFLEKMGEGQPGDLASLLEQLGLTKYLATFVEQDVDLQVFLSLTDTDLKEVGIKLFGPRKKMTNAIARWQAKARVAVGELEQAYGDRLSSELQELGTQLQMACEQVEKLKAQMKQEQQLRGATEACLMEERAAWQHVQRIIVDTRQQCEDFKDVVRKLIQYVTELKARVPVDVAMSTTHQQQQQQQKRPIRGQPAFRGEVPAPAPHAAGGGAKGMLPSNQLPTDSVVRKVDYYMQEIQHLVTEVTGNTDRLLGRNTQTDPAAMDGATVAGYT